MIAAGFAAVLCCLIWLFVFQVYKSIKCDTMKRMGRCTKGIFCAFAHEDGKALLHKLKLHIKHVYTV